MKAKWKKSAVCSALAFGLSALLSAQTLPVGSAASKLVSLTPGVCAQVKEGDGVTLEWNPAFDDMTYVAGLQEMSLFFVKIGQERIAERTRRGLHLSAARRRPLPGEVDDSITGEPNGYYQIRFLIGPSESGEYRLFEAQAQARLPDNFPGRRPEMTNSPTRLPFCLSVAESAPKEIRRPR